MDSLTKMMARHGLAEERIPIPPGFLVDSAEKASELVDTLVAQSDAKLYLDFEGINLCRDGRVCLGQLTFPQAPFIYLLDFVKLPEVLEVVGSGSSSTSLRSILEGNQFTKFIFDPRSDSDALYHTCGKVHLANVVCLQLCDVKRDREAGCQRRLVNGLKRVLADTVPSCQRAEVAEMKEHGLRLFAPELGGSYAVFEERPLSKAIIDYCRVDVAFFSLLEARLYERLSAAGKAWVRQRSAERVAICLGPPFKHGRAMAAAPS